MIDYKKYVLQNGLTLLVNRDEQSNLAALNIVYRVGARNEDPEKTGFAHLFEHLMFGGSAHVPDFDRPVQEASGENNAFTNNDYTDYYIVLPKENVETALWVEADRMVNLNINPDTLDVQKKVVIEEFNQRYLNKPYGDVSELLRSMLYTVHPYRFQTIGATPGVIRDATLADVEAFYNRFYRPENAIVALSGDFSGEEAYDLVNRYFGVLENRPLMNNSSSLKTRGAGEIPAEPRQTAPRRLEVEREVPVSVIYIAFHMGDRLSRDYNVCDTISDILSNGSSARMQQRLVKELRLFSNVNAYISGDVDPGSFTIMGYLMEGVSFETAEKALWEELNRFKTEAVSDYELEKVKNKFEANTVFGELNVMNKAMNLCYYEMLGDVGLINRELDNYRSVTKEEIEETARRIFVPDNSSTLIYKKRDGNEKA